MGKGSAVSVLPLDPIMKARASMIRSEGEGAGMLH
jgi:hypothetical protein